MCVIMFELLVPLASHLMVHKVTSWHKVTGQGDQQLGFSGWWCGVIATRVRGLHASVTAIVP